MHFPFPFKTFIANLTQPFILIKMFTTKQLTFPCLISSSLLNHPCDSGTAQPTYHRSLHVRILGNCEHYNLYRSTWSCPSMDCDSFGCRGECENNDAIQCSPDCLDHHHLAVCCSDHVVTSPETNLQNSKSKLVVNMNIWLRLVFEW